MINKLTFKVMLLVLFSPIYTLLAQTGPGGVGNSTTNGLWLKADDLSLSNGDDVSTWNDVSGNNNHANQTIVNEEPSYISASDFNNYPSVEFNGVRDWLSVADADILDGTAGITYFSVFRPKGLYTSNDVHAIVGKRITYNTNVDYAYTFFLYNNKLTNDVVTNNNRYNSSASFSNDVNYILSFDFDGTQPVASRSSMFRNGDVLRYGSESSTSIINSAQDLTIGTMNVNYDRYSKGEMAELIHYNYKLNTAETIIVNNYLSAKYNIALTANDLYVQDNMANGDFDHNVAGIGQAADGSSHVDSQGTGIVRISNPSNLNNDNFLFWGEETKAVSYALVSNPITYSDQLNTKWRVSKTGSINTVTVTFDISDFSTSVYCDKLKLIVDNDSDFTSPTSYELVVSGTTATATNVVFSDNDYFTVSTPGQIVWDGSAFFNGSGSSNAPNDTDECLKLTVKTGSTAMLFANAHVREVEVEAGAMLQVNDGVLLEVENGIVNNGTITFVDEAQLIQKHTGTSLNSGNGSLSITQKGTSNLYNYNYWSAPVNQNNKWQINYLESNTGVFGFTTSNDADPTASPMELSRRWLYTFNDLNDNYAYWSQIAPTTALIPGIGYIMKGSGNTASTEQEYIFKGTANDGDITVPVLATNEILLGNPYPSAINADEFIHNNIVFGDPSSVDNIIDGSLYFYEHFESNSTHVLSEYEGGYATYNLLAGLAAPSANGGVESKGIPTGKIAVGQGFFVKVENSGDVVFKNSQRVFARPSLNETTFYRTAQETQNDERIKYWIKFRDADDNESTIALGYDTHTSDGFDNGYDSKTFNELSNELYWIIPNEKLSMQGLKSFNVLDDIPLGIKITDSGNYTFQVSETLNFPTGETIYLKDSQTGAFYDIKSSPITLHLTEGVDESRFSIVYEQSLDESLSLEDLNANDISVFYNVKKEVLVLNGIENLNEIKSLKIHNLLGQNVMSLQTVSANQIQLSNLIQGVYVVEIKQTSGARTILKFVKH